jgi:YtkA-like protein
MPSMNMPAMRADGRLDPQGAGVYRGPIDVPMAGRWDVTIAVLRGDQQIGSRQLTLIAH